jgi:hypothetical protein
MLGGSFLSGATSRLLPASIPFRFFLAAAYFHCLAWIALGISAGDAAAFIGGLGIPLAALHLVTLGVLSTTAMGASFQLLPVATRASIRALWQPRLAFWLIFIGVHVLALGMATASQAILNAGAILSAAALALFAYITTRNLWSAPQPSAATYYAWGAVVSLATTIVLGAVLAFDFAHGLLPDHGRVALLHLVLAVFGFFGLLAFGFSGILLPMFALSPSPSERQSRAILVAAAFAVLLATTAILFSVQFLLAIASAGGFAVAVAHVAATERSLAKRMRRKLGLSFVMIRMAHALLVLGLAAGFAVALGAPLDNAATLFGWIVIAGWLLTFLFGVLQRILPFLASMHVGKSRGRPPLLSEIGPQRPLAIHAACHVTALVLVGAGIAAGRAVLVQLGAAIGFAGALAFLWFAATVIRHILTRRAPAAP